MLLAVIADLHANLPALEAVLVEIKELRPDLILCLGDIVGYNAEPANTIDLLRETTKYVVAGNHDVDTISQNSVAGTNKDAQLVLSWTKENLLEKHLSYLANLPNKIIYENEFVGAHGCYLNDTHINGYVTSSMLEENLKSLLNRSNWPTIAFCGHTHIALVGWLENDLCIENNAKEPITWPKHARAVIINPGSVGQPRDEDIRASFALVDLTKRKITIKRVSYDIERTISAINQANLPIKLADRLRKGR
ncbi:MAG: metallophosphoesterase family protein [Acidobacteria bacterium]|nr:metallophosphoesterase family protein [Acidobacteriota bacterium]